MLNKNHNRIGSIIAITLSAVVVGVCAWAVINRQYVFDQWSVWQYAPTTHIQSISDRSSMSDDGRFYFYASQPSVDEADAFNTHCTQQELGNAILGCYANGSIYIYDVPNAQLDGIEEVTASHETLHAVWDRMSDTDKDTVGALLESAYKKINDSALNERMAYYERTEPGERTNELHSILGTEYSNLGTKLETHYSKYFIDRSQVVALHTAYSEIFDTLKAQSDALKAELDAMKSDIDTKTTVYNTNASAVSAESAALNASYDSVDRTNVSQVNAYNAKRQVLLYRIATLDQQRIEINSLSATYNTKITEYNQLITSTNELTKSLDSTLVEAPSL